MRDIVTVTGLLPKSEVGFCQFHEHLLLQKGRSYEINPALCMEDISTSAKEAARFHAAGGRTLIDAQPPGCGRMAEGLAEISHMTGVHIICSTGFHKMIFYPEEHWIFKKSRHELEALFVQELIYGVNNRCEKIFTDHVGEQKAGIIKCALDQENLSLQYEKLFLAAAGAAKQTGRAMMVHIEKGSDPLLLLDFLLDQGVQAHQIVFCHMDRAIPDLAVHKKVLDAGVYLEFDTIGRLKYHSDEQEIALFQTLLDQGYEDQLLFSLDTTRERLKAYNPDGVGLDYILKTFCPAMRNAGISEEQIEKISNKNCINVLTNGD